MESLVRLHLLVLALALFGLTTGTPTASAKESDVITFCGSQVQFANQTQARRLLAEQDDWLTSTGDFQRAATMGKTGPVAVQQFSEHLANAALPWSAAEQNRWIRALNGLATKFAAFRVPLPDNIFLVLTNGTDAANAPYTRGNTIFLPTALSMNYPDAELLAHELFHIVSRNNPALADQFYAVLGFEKTEQLEWPTEWLFTRISNPDAPYNRHFMRIQLNGTSQAVMPVLVANRTKLDPNETFFDVLDVRLLAVTPGTRGSPTLPARNANGQLTWVRADQNLQFLTRLGGNTSYIFHPEETAADNFAYLMTGRNVPNKELLKNLERLLLNRP